MKKGCFEIIVGCMSSGKSEELIRRLRRAQIAKQPVALFKPARDTRTDAVTVASRDGRSHAALSVNLPEDILAWIERENFSGVVGLDEVHFFPASIVEVVEGLVNRGLRVVAAGLDTDFRGQPFEPVPQLMAVADSVVKLNAVCVRCGTAAVRSQLLIATPSGARIGPEFIGGDEKYEARCRDCYEPPE